MNSRSKGKRGELEWRDFLRERGVEAERGQQRAGGPGSPDVKHDLPIHFEVKFTDKLEMWPAIEQAQDDSGELPWAVVTRRTSGPLRRREWVAIVDADWLVRKLSSDRSRVVATDEAGEWSIACADANRAVVSYCQGRGVGVGSCHCFLDSRHRVQALYPAEFTMTEWLVLALAEAARQSQRADQAEKDCQALLAAIDADGARLLQEDADGLARK